MPLTRSQTAIRRAFWSKPATIAALSMCFAVASPATTRAAALPQAGPVPTAHPETPALPQGAPLPADRLTHLLPETVYFQGRTAPLQLRNAAGTTFGHDAVLWVSLVDASGYATSIQERYQFYLVTEAPLRIGDSQLAAGAYGGGFLGNRFLIMDLGGHTVAEGPTTTDAAFPRPRPLQFVPDTPNSVKLYLGRRWVTLRGAADSH